MRGFVILVSIALIISATIAAPLVASNLFRQASNGVHSTVSWSAAAFGRSLASNATIVLTGKLRVLYADTRNGTTSTRYSLELSNATMVALDFSNPPAQSYHNRPVRVTGTLTVEGKNRRMQVASIGPAPGPLAPTTSPTVMGNQPTLVILVKYSDVATEPHTNAYFVADIFSSTSPSLNLYYQENSLNLITGIIGTVVGWYQLPHNRAWYTSACGGADFDPCTTYLRNDAVNAVGNSVTWSSYTRLIIVVNSDLGCGCAFAFIGQNVFQQTPGGPFYYSESFIPDDGWGATAGHGFGIIAHEYGHGLGLYHSGDNYNSLWDVMSGGTYASTGPVHTIGYQKIALGWVTGSAIQTVSSGSYAVNVVANQLETSPPPSGVQVIKVMTSISYIYYTVEVREHVGYDQGLPSPVGVIIHYVDDSLFDWNAKVVMPPSGTVCTYPSCNSVLAAWQAGQTFTDSARSIKIVVKTSTATSFTIDINPPPTVPVTFQLSGVSADATGTILTVDSTNYQVTQFPLTLSLTLATHTVSATNTIPAGTTKQYVWLSWSDSQPASHTITVTGPASYAITYKTQYTLTISISPLAGGSTTPAASGSPYWEDAGTSVGVSETATTGYSFYYWDLDGTNVASGSSYSVLMNAAHVLTAYFRGTSTVSLTSPSSVSLGGSITLSGTITPAQPSPGISTGTTVFLSLSSDGGSTWSIFLTTSTTSGGSYSIPWTPPYPGSYSLRASWSGDQNYAGSTSSSQSLSVTGTMAPSPTLLLSAPSTATHNQIITLSIMVFNPTSTALVANVSIQITGPNNYLTVAVIQIRAAANSQATSYYEWAVPNQTGTYIATVTMSPSLHPVSNPDIAADDTATIQVT